MSTESRAKFHRDKSLFTRSLQFHSNLYKKRKVCVAMSPSEHCVHYNNCRGPALYMQVFSKVPDAKIVEAKRRGSANDVFAQHAALKRPTTSGGWLTSPVMRCSICSVATKSSGPAFRCSLFWMVCLISCANIRSPPLRQPKLLQLLRVLMVFASTHQKIDNNNAHSLSRTWRIHQSQPR